MANEKRLIDANALKESVMKEIRHYWNEGEGGYYLAEDVIPDIDLAPTVDAVEVCRCKDCSYAKDMHPLANAPAYKMGVCTVRKEDGIEFTVWGQDFCSYGERREGE